jgi:hypothetical protein
VSDPVTGTLGRPGRLINGHRRPGDEPTRDAPGASSLERGDRVVMSELGRQRHPRYGLRRGTIVGYGSPNSRRVKFDDSKTVQSIYIGYLELLPPNKATNRCT